jgi:16S rRNA processing protein RimM
MNLSESTNEQATGSPMSGEPDSSRAPVFLVVGKLRRPHGVNGELSMEVLTDFPERLQPGLIVYVGETHQPLIVRRCRSQGSGLLITFEEYSDPETAGLLRNELLYVRTGDLPHLPDGEFYHHQILGLRVVDENGVGLGSVVDILETGANDVCVIRGESGAEFLLPMVDSTLLEIDLAKGFMRVHLLDGLI